MKNSTTEKVVIENKLSESGLAASLQSIFRIPVTLADVIPLQGDASTRRYYRIRFQKNADAVGDSSVVLMQLEKPEPGTDIDFIRLTRFLRGLDLPTPELFYYDTANGLLFLEDCGDTLFEGMVDGNRDAAEKKPWYEKAVRLLADMQFRATRHIGPDCPARHRRFDVEKLMWEFDFMLTHFVCGLKRLTPSKQELAHVRSRFESLCKALDAQKLYFTHRDYHSRNLMVKDGELKILDFQDARMGPCQYDLVSLLRDSYVPLEEDLIRDMTDFYIGLKEAAEGGKTDRNEFNRIFDLMAVQRNLKAVGTFAYQKTGKGTDRYLEYIPRTLGYVRRTLDQRPELAELRESLTPLIHELQAGFEPGTD